MLKNIYPILLCPTKIMGNNTVFYTLDKEIEVSIPAELSTELIGICDGTHSIKILIEYFSDRWSEKFLEKVFYALVKNEALLDARNISALVWKFIKNPTAWKPELSKQEITSLIFEQELQKTCSQPDYIMDIKKTYWTEQLSKRCSSRKFGNQKISKDSLIRILWSGYGSIDSMLSSTDDKSLCRRTIPSAGALYPITLHLCLFMDVGDIAKGIYCITSNHSNRIEMTFLHDRLDDVRKCIVDTTLLNNTVGMIIINGCISRSAMKYGNRGMLYTVLEAGHSTQNILFFAQEEKIATVEVGGFLEEQLSNQLDLDKGVNPLTVIVFGSYLSKEEESEMSISCEKIQIADIVRKIELSTQIIGNYTLPYCMVFVESLTPSTGNIWWSCGRDVDKQQAEIKARAEAVEWFVCGHVVEKNLIEGSLNEFGSQAINPQNIVSYLSHQFEKVQPFNLDSKYQWFKVKELDTNLERLVLADLIFFPYFPKYQNRYAFANSSGVAAHVTLDQAIEHAVIESIEREAFMVTWLNYLKRPVIVTDSLPDNLKQRIEELEKNGFCVKVVDITFDLTPVLMIVIVKNDRSFLTCSTASGYYIEKILDRVLMEAEASVYCHLKNGSSRLILTPDEVIRAADHAAFYENPERIKKAEFLLGDDNLKITFSDVKTRTNFRKKEDLYKAVRNAGLSILVANLTEQKELSDLPYKVVRVLIPGMVPMNFGHGIESLGLDRVKSLPVKCGLLDYVVDNLNLMPHPFN